MSEPTPQYDYDTAETPNGAPLDSSLNKELETWMQVARRIDKADLPAWLKQDLFRFMATVSSEKEIPWGNNLLVGGSS